MKARQARLMEMFGTGKGMQKRPPILMRAIPAIERLERGLLLYGSSGGVLSARADDMIWRTSEEVFGIIEADTMFEWPEDYESLPAYSDELFAINCRYEDHEDQFETAEMTDDEAVAHLKKLGLDFSDARGFPLRCTLHLRRQAEAAAKGIMGKMPDRDALNLDQWGSSLKAQAEAFMAKKRSARG